MAADVQGNRLFVTGLENHSLEVVDLAKGKLVHSIGGIKEPQGLLYLPQSRQILVCSRGDGTCSRPVTHRPFWPVNAVLDGLDALDTTDLAGNRQSKVGSARIIVK